MKKQGGDSKHSLTDGSPSKRPNIKVSGSDLRPKTGGSSLSQEVSSRNSGDHPPRSLKKQTDTLGENAAAGSSISVSSNKTARSARRASQGSATSFPQSETSLMSPPTDPLDPQLKEDRSRVRVFVRIRPRKESETTSEVEETLKISEDQRQIHQSDKVKDSDFQFDHVFSPTSTHKEIFRLVGKPIVKSAMNGFNGTLMAYGQTGAGKTHTITSPDGLIPRLVNHLFKKIASDKEFAFTVKCSCIQIYNEKIYDLFLVSEKKSKGKPATSNSSLNGNGNVEGTDLNLRESPNDGVYIEDLTEYIVRSPQEVFQLIRTARSSLVVAETKMNRASSRSHAITFLSVERTPIKDKNYMEKSTHAEDYPVINIEEEDFSEETGYVDDDTDPESDNGDPISPTQEGSSSVLTDYVLKGRITICDLAGSERIKKTLATGERLNEAQQINLSLLELGNVIHALTDPKRIHVPFRNSTLTRLLTESLGGNCLTRLIVCVSPSSADASETKGTLSFGMRAMRVKNNARVNMEVDYKSVAEGLEKHLRQLENEWKSKEAAWKAQMDDMLSKKSAQAEMAGTEDYESKLQVLQKLNDETAEKLLKLEIASHSKTTILETAAKLFPADDLQGWILIQKALGNLEISVMDMPNASKHLAEAKLVLGMAAEKMPFKSKTLSQLMDWASEFSQFSDSGVVFEKWTAASPAIYSALVKELQAVSQTFASNNKSQEAVSLVECLHRLLSPSAQPSQNSLAESRLVEKFDNLICSNPVLFGYALIPLLLQLQCSERLLFVSRVKAHQLEITNKIQEFEKRIAQMAKHDRDIDDMLDRKADKKAARCRAGGKECVIM